MKKSFNLKNFRSLKPIVSNLALVRQKSLPKYTRRTIPFRKLWERLDWIEPESGPPVRVALDIGSTSVRSLMLEHADDKIRLIDIRFVPCASEPIANLGQELKRIFTEKFEENVRVHTAVSGASTLVRYISMPHMNEKEFHQSMNYEAEKYIPYQISEVVVDSYLIGDGQDERGKKITKGILAVCKKDAIRAVIEACREAEAPLAVIDAPPLAIINAFQFNYPESMQEVVGLLHVGHNACNLSILLKGEPVFTREISFGGTDITQAIMKSLSLNPEQAEKRKLTFDWTSDSDIRPVVEQTLGFLSQEIKLSFNYFENHVAGAEAPSKVCVSGATSQLDHFQQTLSEQLGTAVTEWDPLARIEIDPRVDTNRIARLKPGLAVCVGLALR